MRQHDCDDGHDPGTILACRRAPSGGPPAGCRGRLYRQILAVEPNPCRCDSPAGHGRLSAQGQHEVAAQFVQRAIVRLDGNAAVFHNNLSQVFKDQGKAGREQSLADTRRAPGTEAGPSATGAQQSRQCIESSGEAGRSGRLLPPGIGTEARLCRGAQQSGKCAQCPGEAGRSAGLLSPGRGAEARFCRGPLQPGRTLPRNPASFENAAC